LFERLFDLPHQATLWTAGFIIFAFLCGFAALKLRSATPVEPAAAPEPESLAANPALNDEPSAFAALLWLVLPGFASAVLMATTNHVSTDVAVVPLLWIVPL